MSVRAVGVRLWKHGRTFVQTICKRDIHTNTNIGDKINATIQQQQQQLKHQSALQLTPQRLTLRNVGVQLGLQARRILIDNVLNRVTNSLASDLRKRAARRILYGDSGPFFALVGVSLASGTGILTKEEELEGVCYEIREAVSKIKWNHDVVDDSNEEFETITKLDDLSLGQPIAKGANGIVYRAKLQNPQENNKENDPNDSYPLALKMLFNYDIQSNSMAILKAMYRETVPARYYLNKFETEWEAQWLNHGKLLPPHPNIVKIYSIFTDYIQDFENSKELYPAALPKRLHPDGIGRNMSLFLLMKRYNTNLEGYLKTTTQPLSIRTSILIFAQLLEGIVHINRYGIAHRDLKSDNLLIDTDSDHDGIPIVVLSDFGCCLADKHHGLQLPYTSDEIDKGGNHALMAPEIINKKPGLLSILNYNKSDLWSVGTIAYEIFGCPNPFYFNNKNNNGLRNVNYKDEDLPQLPENVPQIIRLLIGNLLRRNPNKRLDPEVAANVVQLYLWAPGAWLKKRYTKLPSNAEILQWLLSLTTKMLCEGGINSRSFGQYGNKQQSKGRRTFPEYLLISSFLCRVKLASIRLALSWIHDNVDEIDY